MFRWTFCKGTEKLENSISRKKTEKKGLKSHQRNWLYLSSFLVAPVPVQVYSKVFNQGSVILDPKKMNSWLSITGGTDSLLWDCESSGD